MKELNEVIRAIAKKYPLALWEDADAIAENEKVCNYLDMPLQHAADSILSAMRRNITNAQTRDLIHKIRERIPSIAIRTTILVGFPNETEDDFKATLSLIDAVGYAGAFSFKYSARPGTPATEMPDRVPEGRSRSRNHSWRLGFWRKEESGGNWLPNYY